MAWWIGIGIGSGVETGAESECGSDGAGRRLRNHYRTHLNHLGSRNFGRGLAGYDCGWLCGRNCPSRSRSRCSRRRRRCDRGGTSVGRVNRDDDRRLVRLRDGGRGWLWMGWDGENGDGHVVVCHCRCRSRLAFDVG